MCELLLAVAALCCLSAPALAGPSFNCNRASFADEFVICSDMELSRLDQDMAGTYADYMNMYHGGFRRLIQATQVGWLDERHRCGYNKDCIENAYHVRFGSLGDGDILINEWCRNNNFDIDCRGVHPAPPTTTPTIPVCYAVSDDGYVNVRERPNGPIMGPVPVGTQLQVIKTWYDPASRTNWSEVQTPWLASRGQTGVVASYLIDCQNG